MKIVDSFFDRKAVTGPAERAKKRNLSRRGSALRRRMRGKLRRTKKKVSRPGEPPRIHTPGKRNLKLILFAYVKETQSVVVGPVKFNAQGKDVPAVLEHGGIATFKDGSTATMKARPFAGPSLEEEAGAAGEDWEGAIGP